MTRLLGYLNNTDLRAERFDHLVMALRCIQFFAEQNATTKKTLTDQRVQEEAIASALKDISDRLAEANAAGRNGSGC